MTQELEDHTVDDALADWERDRLEQAAEALYLADANRKPGVPFKDQDKSVRDFYLSYAAAQIAVERAELRRELLYPTREQIQKRLKVYHDSPLVDTVLREARRAVDNAVKELVSDVLHAMRPQPARGPGVCFEWALSEKFRKYLERLAPGVQVEPARAESAEKGPKKDE